jgi:putative ABC transport system substrate-binding protein
VDALIVYSGAFWQPLQDRLITLTAQHAIPAIFANRAFPEAGGLMSYGADARDAFRHAALYVARILRGEKPVDLPVLQPTKFELVINMRTVKKLGLAVPPGLLAIADEVIE